MTVKEALDNAAYYARRSADSTKCDSTEAHAKTSEAYSKLAIALAVTDSSQEEGFYKRLLLATLNEKVKNDESGSFTTQAVEAVL